MQNHPDPFVESPVIEKLLNDYFKPESPDRVMICIESGYFPPSILPTLNNLILAFEHIQPKFIRRHRDLITDGIASIEIFIKSQTHIRYSLVDRAEEMLPIAESIFPPDSEYVLSLRVLTGRRIDPDLLSGLVTGWATLSSRSNSALRLMVIVAHPQLPEDLATRYEEIFQFDIYSSVYYDLIRYIRVVEAGEGVLDHRKLARLYAVGKLWDAYSTNLDRLRELMSAGLGGEPERGDFQERYQQILQILRS